jgi:3'(2'), 5'-bisphosphate nucleotidase
MSFFHQSQTKKIISFALTAGEIATKFFLEKNFEIKKKSDGSQVTSADVAVSEFLREKLAQEFPQIPVICEEGDLREAGDIFFLIDPIDGTSSFIANSVEFAINIALVQNKKAIFGLIYAPLFEGGKMIFSDENDKVKISSSLKRSSEDLMSFSSDVELMGSSARLRRPRMTGLQIITSSRSKDSDIQTYLAQSHPEFLQNFSVEKLASAIKFFRILENDADLYLHFRRSMEWDTAAGQALIELLGGKVKNLFFNQSKSEIGEDLIYKKPDFENQPFVASLTDLKIYG